jgi:hypothetical protein
MQNDKLKFKNDIWCHAVRHPVDCEPERNEVAAISDVADEIAFSLRLE